eukprot:6279520-Prymnesium_polylepis.1
MPSRVYPKGSPSAKAYCAVARRRQHQSARPTRVMCRASCCRVSCVVEGRTAPKGGAVPTTLCEQTTPKAYTHEALPLGHTRATRNQRTRGYDTAHDTSPQTERLETRD